MQMKPGQIIYNTYWRGYFILPNAKLYNGYIGRKVYHVVRYDSSPYEWLGITSELHDTELPTICKLNQDK